MSEPRKLEVGAYATPPWEYSEGPMLVAANWYGKIEAHDNYKRVRLEAHRFTPCDPPPDSPLGRAEARVEVLEQALRDIKAACRDSINADRPVPFFRGVLAGISGIAADAIAKARGESTD